LFGIAAEMPINGIGLLVYQVLCPGEEDDKLSKGRKQKI
jgi:hypothetical protein